MNLSSKALLTQIHALPLKEMEASLLSHAINDHMSAPWMRPQKVEHAIALAGFAHRAKTRATRGAMPRTHYIEHPLRVALRVIRYGCTNPETIIAAILHDTVEDHALELAEAFGGGAGDEGAARAIVLDAYREEFGGSVATIVEALSNPLPTPGLSREERNERYLTHVSEAIQNASVCVVKFSDFVDNGLSLHHTMGAGDTAMASRLAVKYLPLVEVFRSRLDRDDILHLVGEDGIRKMREHLGHSRLAEFAAA